MTTRAVTYARVSGDDRGKEGRNLEGQLEMCREYAERRGYEIIAELAEDDRGASGAEIDLPQLNLLREMASGGQFDVLVVREIDRLSRNLAKQLIVERGLEREGVKIEYALSEYPDTSEGRLQKHIKGAIAEYEREKIAERSVRGRRQKVKAGHVLVHGRPPYGYRECEVDGKQTLEIHEAEARIVRLIFKLYTEGNGDGSLSQRAITDHLTEMRIPTVGDKDPGTAKQRGRGVWNRTSVRKILKRETYIGTWHYGKVKRTSGGANVPNDRDHWLSVEVPAIIDQATFDAAQRQLTVNRRNSRRNTKHDYLIGRRARCGRCGKTIAAKCIKNHGKQYFYYSCAQASGVPGYAGECDQRKWFRVDQVDGRIWSWIVEQFTNTERLLKTLGAVRERRAAEAEPLQKESDAVSELLREKRAQLQRALDLYIGGEYPREWLDERTDALRKTIDGLERQHVQIKDRIEKRTLSDQQVDDIVTTSKEIAAGLDEASEHFDKRRQLIELLDLRAVLDVVDGEQLIEVECKVTLDPAMLSVAGTSTLSRSTGRRRRSPGRTAAAGSASETDPPPCPS